MSGPSTAARISRERDLLGRAGEHVAAADAALRAHQPRALHREQDLLEVRLGEVGALRDLLHRRRAVGPVQRERQQRTRRVVASGRHLHPPMRRTSARSGGAAGTDRVTRAAVTTATPVRPDYGGASVERDRPGAHRAAPTAPGCPEPARDATTVVLLVLDGLGLGAARGAPVRGCPSSAALTGGADHHRRPVDHRVGADVDHHRPRADPARDRSGSGCASTARCSTSCAGPSTEGRPPDPFRVQRHPPFLGRSVPVVTRSEFRTSGFTDGAPARRAVPRLEHARRCSSSTAARSSRPATPVRVRVLPGGRHRRARVRAARRVPPRASSRSPTSSSAGCSTRCPPEAALLVTADHGEVHVGDDWYDLTPLARARARLQRARVASAGSTRARGRHRRARGRGARRVRPPGVGDDARRAARRAAGSAPVRCPRSHLRRLGDVALLPARAGRVRRPGDAGGAPARRRPRLAHARRRCWSRSWPAGAGVGLRRVRQHARSTTRQSWCTARPSSTSTTRVLSQVPAV